MKNYRILCLAVAAVFALSACGSSGGGGGVNIGGNQGGGNQGGGQVSHVKSLPVNNDSKPVSIHNNINAYGLLANPDPFRHREIDRIKVTLPDGSTPIVKNGESLDISSIPLGSVQKLEIVQYEPSNVFGIHGDLHILRRAYSAVVRHRFKHRYLVQADWINFETDRMAPIEGQRTPPSAVPTGELRYQGTAFTATARGTFNYTIGANRYGSGRITGLSGSKGDLTLDSAQMKGSSFSGFVTYDESNSGSYRLELFGPKAEEIAGHAFHPDYHKNTDNSISLSGTRQEKP